MPANYLRQKLCVLSLKWSTVKYFVGFVLNEHDELAFLKWSSFPQMLVVVFTFTKCWRQCGTNSESKSSRLTFQLSSLKLCEVSGSKLQVYWSIKVEYFLSRLCYFSNVNVTHRINSLLKCKCNLVSIFQFKLKMFLGFFIRPLHIRLSWF